MFLFISGYLLLSRTYDDRKCHIFWKKNCLRLLITTEIWIVLYNIFLHVNGIQAFSITDIVKQLLFVKLTNMSHMWYMPMILGMYVLIPFAANALHSVQTSTVFYATALYMVIAAIFPILDILSKSCGYGDFYSILSTGFSGGEYGIYLLLGFLCHKGILKKVRSYILCIFGTVCFILAFLLQMFAYSHQYPYNVWYNCGFLMLSAFCIFELLSRVSCRHFSNIPRAIAKYSFGIYLIHNPIIIKLHSHMDFVSSRAIRVLLLWIVTFTISWLFAFLIDCIPHAGKYVLHT